MIVDFEKAFDSVSWRFIHKVIPAFNFGESISNWLITFYSNINSTIMQNGNFSNLFNRERGCRQGDPLSSYLFILCSEFVAMAIRDNPQIKGIKIGGFEHKLTQYADDSTLFIDGDKTTLQNALKIFDK
jgi:hypothetical protein